MIALKVLWLALPVCLAAALHIAVLKLKLLEVLKLPLDGGLTLRGERLFGDNKTVRGVVVMVAGAVLGAWIQARWARVPGLELFDYGAAEPTLLGVALGLGFAAGELPNSFLKRRVGIGPGQRGGPFYVVLDQVDSVIGCLAALAILAPAGWVPSLEVWAVTLVLASGLHVAFNSVFVLLGLKERVF